MRKNKGFSEINFMTLLLKHLVYMLRIFSVLEKITHRLFFLIILSKSTWVCFMWVCHSVGLYGTSWPNKKRYIPEIWYSHSTTPYLKRGFLFFRKIDPDDRLHRKTAASREFSTYFLDFLVFNHFWILAHHKQIKASAKFLSTERLWWFYLST